MTASAPPGWRGYAIGDIHGRLDLVERLEAAIVADHQARPPAKALIVWLGDLIDRGPDSRGVVERGMAPPPPGFERIVLGGNHEDVLVSLLDGDPQRLGGWLRYGGGATLRSFGVEPQSLPDDDDEVMALLNAAMPDATADWLRTLPDTLAFGDYLFVHAGVRPGVPLDRQSPQDLRWIRDDFLTSNADFGAIVVHGHTIFPTAEVHPNRIAIDTGAWKSGVLTAVGLEGQQRWLLDTR